GDKDQADGGEVTELGEIVETVRIDDRHRGRQLLVGLMVVDDDDVKTHALGLGERLDAGGAAIDGNQQLRPTFSKRLDGGDVRPVTFEDAIGDVDERFDPGRTQKTCKQRGACGSIDVVVAEDGDAFTAYDGVCDPRRRRF